MKGHLSQNIEIGLIYLSLKLHVYTPILECLERREILEENN